LSTTPTEKRLRVAFVVSDESNYQTFHHHAPMSPIDFVPFNSLSALERDQATLPDYAGILIDLQSAISASTSEKDYLRSLPKKFKIPLFEMAIPSLHSSPDQVSAFLSRYQKFQLLCKEYSAEMNLRAFPRKLRIIRVKISQSADLSSPEIKAATADISEGGCFIVSFADCSSLKEVFLRFEDSSLFIPCRVAWVRKWEQSSQRYPGMGIQFLDLSPRMWGDIQHHFVE